MTTYTTPMTLEEFKDDEDTARTYRILQHLDESDYFYEQAREEIFDQEDPDFEAESVYQFYRERELIDAAPHLIPELLNAIKALQSDTPEQADSGRIDYLVNVTESLLEGLKQ